MSAASASPVSANRTSTRLIAPVYSKYTNPVTTVLSSPGDLFVHLRATGETEEQADALLREVGNPIAALLGRQSLLRRRWTSRSKAVMGRLLRKHHGTVAVAESCTGGMVSARLTEQAGSSDYFLAGLRDIQRASEERGTGDLLENSSASTVR